MYINSETQTLLDKSNLNLNTSNLDDIYEKLRERVESFAFGYSETKQGADCLRLLFDPEEALIFVAMGYQWVTAKEIAQEMNVDESEMINKMYTMSKNGLIFRERKDGMLRYRAVAGAHGFFEYNVHRWTKEVTDNLGCLLGEGMAHRYYKDTPIQRALPISKVAVVEGELLPIDDAYANLASKKRIAIASCICSMEKDHSGGGTCRHNTDRCMLFDEVADFFVENNAGRYISHAHAEKLYKMCEDEGLVIHVGNSFDMEFGCLCCKDCCQLIQFARDYPGPGISNYGNYYVLYEKNKCTNCELCIDRCPMNARTASDDKIAVDLDKCIGCGLCVTKCPPKANILKRKEKPYSPPGLSTWFDSSLEAGIRRGLIPQTESTYYQKDK